MDLWWDQLRVVHMNTINTLLFPGVQALEELSLEYEHMNNHNI